MIIVTVLHLARWEKDELDFLHMLKAKLTHCISQMILNMIVLLKTMMLWIGLCGSDSTDLGWDGP